MGRERYESQAARFTARVTSFLARDRRIAERVQIDAIPQDQEIVLMVNPLVKECADTRVFDGERTLFSSPPSRIHPNV